MALDGVNVLDLSDSIGGAYCTKLLADLGASVILVERPGSGHPLREAGPFPKEPDIESSGLFLYTEPTRRASSATSKRRAAGVGLETSLPAPTSWWRASLPDTWTRSDSATSRCPR